MKAVTASEILDQFRTALIARDIVPPDTIIADGRLHRCNAAGARGRGGAAYLLHLDGMPAAGMENWRDGRGWQAWRLDLDRQLSAPECDAMRTRWQAATAQRREESEWPEPEPLNERLDPLPYPVDALPPMLRNAVREAQAFVQAPMALVACSALAVLSVAGQGLVNVHRDRHPPLIGPVEASIAPAAAAPVGWSLSWRKATSSGS